MPHYRCKNEQCQATMGATRTPAVALLLAIALLLLTTVSTPLKAAPALHPAAYPTPPVGCNELVTNGTFESPIFLNWSPQGFVVADPSVKIGGTFSARIGLTASDPNQNIASSIRQTINLPAGFDISLSFQWFPKFDLDISDADIQFVNIQTANGSIIPVVSNTKQNSTTWLPINFPLNSFAGQQITLIFGVNNDGVGSKTWMYVDDVSIIACPTPSTATPTPTITATMTPTPPPTPLPEGCVTTEIPNGGFENDTAWIFGDDPTPPSYVSNPVRSGVRSVRLGIDPATTPGVSGKESFSSIRQAINLPTTANVAKISWWHYDRTEEGVLSEAPRMILVDRQEMVLLNMDLSTAAVLYSARLNSGAWVQTTVDLINFRGRPLFLYFNVLNDGNNLRTWQFIDDVTLTLCYPPTPIPTPTSPPTATPTPTITATDTPLPMATAMDSSAPPTIDPNTILRNQGDPVVENVAASSAQTASATPAATLWFGRAPGDVLIWVGVMVGGLAIIGMLAWLIRQYRGPNAAP
ncbi:MAG TPA: hypothetical protein GX400_16975 [Chloroflexi bacterium]|nr:hypothetical protein [Chloroflexota bacterium]